MGEGVTDFIGCGRTGGTWQARPITSLTHAIVLAVNCPPQEPALEPSYIQGVQFFVTDVANSVLTHGLKQILHRDIAALKCAWQD